MKSRALEFLGKRLVLSIWIMAILTIIGFFRGCSISGDVSTAKKTTKSVEKKVDSLIAVTPDVEEMIKITSLKYEKVGLETARNVLYHESAIDRKEVEIGAVMDEYNKKIEKLEDKIEELENKINEKGE